MLNGRHLILVEDDALMGHSLVQRLELEGADVTWVKHVARAIPAIRTPRRRVDAVICDIRLPDGTGEEVFNTVSRTAAPPPFLFITGQGEIDQAVRLLRAGGADYLTKPFDMGDFLQRLTQILRTEVESGLPAQTGVSALARQVDAQLAEFAGTDRPVLIRGAGGLGKARLARQLHDMSDRRAAPFVTFNARASEATAASLQAAAKEASDGTLYISGLGRLDPPAQGAVMAILEAARARVIASCGTQIEEKVENGAFRSDLLYALMACEIAVPPLAQRPDDAVWLATQMFQALNDQRATPLRGLTDLAMAAMRDHDWPGNGRELRSRLLRAMDVATGEWIFPVDIFPELGQSVTELRTLAEAREMAERRQIIAALEHTDGQVGAAARLLKVSRTTLWEKMQKLNL